MNKNVLSLLSLCLSLLLIAGCNTKEEPVVSEPPEEKTEKPVEEFSVDAEEDEEEDEAESDEPERELGDYEVYLGGEMVETEDKIIINGESNLLPGARVIGEVLIDGEDGQESIYADTSELVEEDGSFYMKLDHHDYDEETRVAVRFHFDGNQKDGIQRHYGDRGQKLTGPYVYQHRREVGGRSPKDIYQQAKVETTFEHAEELAVRHFKEPEWYEIPDDMGDPRVWIEIEEINDDKEYYYIHGRSNLLEGSRIRGEFKYKRDEAHVKPDGSFDLKIEYEYREDTPIVITFDPNRWQWNPIEEAYGKEGQRLVGDLVVANKHNKRQIIQKEVPLESTEITVPDNVDLTIDGTEVTMSVPDNLLFDFDKYNLKGDAKKTLLDIGKTLKQFKRDIEIVINGHTDNVGNKKYNNELSEKRAEEVREFLKEQGDLKDANFKTKGYGSSRPIASNDSEAGQAKNRRVEIVINLR